MWEILGPESQVIATFRSTEPMWRNWGHWGATEEDLARAENTLIMFGGIMPKQYVLVTLPW